MKQKHRLWITGFLVIVIIALIVVCAKVLQVDPFFHYHKPYTNRYFYKLDNQRSQNDGIIKHFDYNGLITGTSMTENFKTSEAEALWGGTFIKVSFSGGTYKEINDNIATALLYNPDLNIIIRGLDMGKFFEDKNTMRSDLGQFPTYLYDNNVFNDVQYVYNRDVIFNRVYPMTKANDRPGFTPGITSFDVYSNWMKSYKFGKNVLFPDGIKTNIPDIPKHLSDDEIELVKGNVQQNLISLPEKYPNVDFYYFFPPYSAKWWMEQYEKGDINKYIEAEKIVINELLNYPNIKLFSFNCCFDIITDLNNYKDSLHYGEWINSLLLKNMYDNKYLLTAENYNEYLKEEMGFYTSYDYSQMNDQIDYDYDYYASFFLLKETYGIEGKDFNLFDDNIELQKATLVDNQFNNKPGILCSGTLDWNNNDNVASIEKYIYDTDFIGAKISIDDITSYKYISFYGKKISGQGQPLVCVYDDKGTVLTSISDAYNDIDNEWKQYIIDISNYSGEVTIIFNGGYIDSKENTKSQYIFSDISFY